MKLTGHVPREIHNLVGKPEMKEPLGRPVPIYNYVKIDLRGKEEGR
jgi:hypothetical protein